MEQYITRRQWLSAVGATGVGLYATKAVAATEANTATTLSIGISHEVDRADRFFGSNTDGQYGYDVAESDGRLTVFHTTTEAERNAIESASLLVGRSSVTPAPVSLSRGSAQSAVVESGSTGRPIRRIQLSSAIETPAVAVKSQSDLARATVQGDSRRVDERTTEEFSLPTQTSKARVSTVTDETVEIPSIPEYRRGPKTAFETVEIEITPVVVVRNHGDLSVRFDELT